jgi:hypothetical protein
MDQKAVDNLILAARVAVLELMVIRLDVAINALRPERSKSAALEEALASYGEAAATLERLAFQGRRFLRLSDTERALITHEYRETIERTMTRAREFVGR